MVHPPPPSSDPPADPVRPGMCRIGVFLAIFLLLCTCRPMGEEKSVTGTLVRLDREERTLTVQDGLGGRWNFLVDRDAGVDLAGLREGSTVRVTIARGTPPNMISAADRIRKGDRIEPVLR